MAEESIHLLTTVPISLKHHLHQFFLNGFNHLHRVKVKFYLEGISFSWKYKNYTTSIGYGTVRQETLFLVRYLDYLTLNHWFESIPGIFQRITVSFYYRLGFIDLYFNSSTSDHIYHLDGMLYETETPSK